MNDRQEALLDYMKTIAPYLIGARSTNEIVDRVFSCVREDIAFVVTGFTGAIVGKGRKAIENKTNDAVGWVVGIVSSFVSPKKTAKKPSRR